MNDDPDRSSDDAERIRGKDAWSPHPSTADEHVLGPQSNDRGPVVPRGFVTEKMKGKGQDGPPFAFSWDGPAEWRTLIAVFDGMGGAGSTPVPSLDEPDILVPMAYLASRAAQLAFERACHQFGPDTSPRDIKRILEDALTRQLRQLMDREGGVPESRMRGALVKNYPTTVAAALIDQLDDGSRRVTSMWSGDSRVYTLIPRQEFLLQQLTQDHSTSDGSDSGGDAALTKCLTPESCDMEMSETTVPPGSVVMVATDGCFAYRSMTMFLTTLIEQLDRSHDDEILMANLASALSQGSGDDCSMVISFCPTLPFHEAKNTFAQFLRPLQDLRLVPDGNPFVTIAGSAFYTRLLDSQA